MKGNARNKPCWCGSGKKFKKCHWSRSSQEKENPWNAIERNRRAFSLKRCCASGLGLGECDGKIVKAHTISRGPNLTKIAENGHVLHHAATINDLRKSRGKLKVKKIGINEASVFSGFCAKHDRELFSCIENEPFAGRPDQCLAVAYRTISRELYLKDAAAHQRDSLRGADKGRSIAEQLAIQKILSEIDIGNEAARREAEATRNFLASAIGNCQFNAIDSLILEFSEPLPFMCSGAWSPFKDLENKELQDGYLDQNLEQIFVSTFATKEGGKICISWRDIPNAPG